MSSRKRGKLDEFRDLEAISGSPNAKVEGVVTELSPMKEGKSREGKKRREYFEGWLDDGKKSVRMVGFTPTVRRKLAEKMEGGSSLSLSHCKVQFSSFSKDMELLLSDDTEVVSSPKKFKVTDKEAKGSQSGGGESGEVPLMLLRNVVDLPINSRVTVEGKVIRVDAAKSISEGRKLQNVVIADEDACLKMSLWEAEVGSVEEMKSYRFSGVMVRSFMNKKHLSTCRDRCSIENIDDIGDVVSIESLDEEKVILKNAQVVGVLDFKKVTKCLYCSGSVIKEDADFGKCDSCLMLQMIDGSRSLSVKMLILDGDGQQRTVRAFGAVVEEIARLRGDDVTERKLLKAARFSAVEMDGVLQSVSRGQ